MHDTVGTKLYGLRVSNTDNQHSYLIFPMVYTIEKIYFHETNKQANQNSHPSRQQSYATYICKFETYNSIYTETFDVIGSEIIGRTYIAGRARRLYRNLTELKKEANLLKRLMLNTIKDAKSVKLVLINKIP